MKKVWFNLHGGEPPVDPLAWEGLKVAMFWIH